MRAVADMLRRGRRHSAVLTCAALLALSSLGAAPAQSAEPLRVRVGYQGIPDKLLPMILKRQDIVPHLGKSYDFELVNFRSSSEEITALAAGELELATLGYSSFGIAIENAHLDDVRLVADLFRDGVEGYYSTQFMVLNDSPVTSVPDLKGRIVASNGAGSVTDIPERYMLRRSGLEANRDYTIIEAPIANVIPMLLERKIDLANVGASYSQLPDILAKARTLFTAREAFGTTQWAFLAGRADFLATNKVPLVDFFEDLVRETRWLIDPANRDEAVRMFAGYGKQKVEVVSAYFLTRRDVYRDPDAKPDLVALARNLQAMRELGFLKSEIDVGKHTDLSFIETAASRLR